MRCFVSALRLLPNEVCQFLSERKATKLDSFDDLDWGCDIDHQSYLAFRTSALTKSGRMFGRSCILFAIDGLTVSSEVKWSRRLLKEALFQHLAK